LDILTFYDDIELVLCENSTVSSGQGDLTQEELTKFKVKPFQHQIDAINFGLKKQNWLLLDSMGLGKSLTAMYLAETLYNRGCIDHCMIICGVDSLRQNWKNEIQKFSNLPAMVLGEKISKKGKISYMTVPQRVEQLKNPISEFFVIINAATLRNDKVIDALKKAKSNKFGMIVVDECHRFVNKSSAQGSNLLKLKADWKLAMTGTPIINSPVSAYIPLAWTENDSSTLTMLKSQYCEYGGFQNHQIIGYQNIDILKEELQACSLRRTLDQVRSDMQPKNINVELVEMSDEQAKFYDAVVNGVKEEADKIHLNSANLLALTTRLRQATSCPTVLTTQKIPNSKIDRCIEMVEDLVSQGEKVVIMSGFKETVYDIAKRLEQYNPLVSTGDTPDAVHATNTKSFQEDPNLKIMIGTMQKISTGLTLNAASYLIMVDEFWTAALNSQAHDRIWRVTNDRPAFVTILMNKDTIDEHVHEVAQYKQDLSDYMIDDVQNYIADSLKQKMLKIIKDL
jgi:SNF2 family DNA or RNA helicase